MRLRIRNLLSGPKAICKPLDAHPESCAGPNTWSQDIKDKQLTQLLWDREAAWLKAASMYIAWEEVLAAGGSLQKACKSHPIMKLSGGQLQDLGHCKRTCHCRTCFVWMCQ